MRVGEDGGAVEGWGGMTYLVEGTILVVLGETVLLQEVILQEASRLQSDLVPLSQRVLQQQTTMLMSHLFRGVVMNTFSSFVSVHMFTFLAFWDLPWLSNPMSNLAFQSASNLSDSHPLKP